LSAPQDKFPYNSRN